MITKPLLDKLKIALPLNAATVDMLSDYFEAEEISLAQDQAAHIPFDEQYMKDVCRAVDDLDPCGENETLDIDDLNSRLIF